MSTRRHILARLYAALPHSIQMMVAREFVRRKRSRLAGFSTPTAVILYVTQRCNARCAHCFYWKELEAPGDELSLDELQRLASSFKHRPTISITGGEPFIRKDIFEVAESFHKMAGCLEIGFATNGMLTERIVETCEKVAALPLESVGVQVSLDGLERTHNNIRGVPAFKPAVETIRQLAQLARREPRFSVHVSCCIQKKNFGELREFVEFMIPFRVPLRFALVRGESFGTWSLPEGASSGIDPRDRDSPLVPVEQLEEFFAWLKKRNDESRIPFWSPMQRDKIAVSLRMLREQRKCLMCYAGSIDGVVYANGDVALCEMTRPVGNLRDFDMDIGRLWQAAGADEMRQRIRACFCIHGCNLVTGLLFRPEHVREAILTKAR